MPNGYIFQVSNVWMGEGFPKIEHVQLRGKRERVQVLICYNVITECPPVIMIAALYWTISIFPLKDSLICHILYLHNQI